MNMELRSWNDGPARRSIIDFVADVTDPSSERFVPPEERIATFDNDGTLWCERPFVQGGFVIQQLASAADADPSLRDIQPWKMAYEGDLAWLGAAMVKHYNGDDEDAGALLAAVATSFSDISVDAFSALADEYFQRERHPSYGCSYLDTAYVPMIELLGYLAANGFTNYIVSGGGRDFMRPITDRVYKIPPERVIGSAPAMSFAVDDDGAHIMRGATLEFLDDGPTKPILIWDRTGRRPILAAGNANGDIPMLQFTGGTDRPALRLLLHHDDGEREFAYDAGAEQALRTADEQGWNVVSMQSDWKRVFAFQEG
jgi:phosphoglycolate phosphatase-like HAD superfamily hydrolase